MAECAWCSAPTQLYDNGVPVCLKCSEAREVKRKPSQVTGEIRRDLVGEVVEATTKLSLANQHFCAIMDQFPGGLPHPDGVRRIKNASNELTVARKQMMTAHKRLTDFMERGIVPDDLKRSG